MNPINSKPAATRPILSRATKIFELLEDISGPLCLALLVVVLGLQVGGRAAGLGTHLTWTDETARILFIWSVFLSLPLASKRGVLVHIKLSEALCPSRLKPHLHWVSNFLWGLTAIFIAALSLVNIYSHWQYPQLTPILGLNQNYLQLVIPLAFSMVALRTFNDLFRGK